MHLILKVNFNGAYIVNKGDIYFRARLLCNVGKVACVRGIKRRQGDLENVVLIDGLIKKCSLVEGLPLMALTWQKLQKEWDTIGELCWKGGGTVRQKQKAALICQSCI